MRNKVRVPILPTLLVLLGMIAIESPAAHAGNVSFVYDMAGRLLAAFDGNGNVTNYQYDLADNITAILTGSASAEAVFGYSPDHGNVGGGTSVTIYGNNFGSNPTVTFNSSPATVVSSNSTQIVATAPICGLVCVVTVSSSTGSATGPRFFNQ